MARKSNTSQTQMDKGTFFFATACGACHPGDGALKYDRQGLVYWQSVAGADRFQAAADGTGGVASIASITTGAALPKLDGDYGFIHANGKVFSPNTDQASALVADPNFGRAVTAKWNVTGVGEADCLMCHLTGYSWKNRAMVQTAGTGLKLRGSGADAGKVCNTTADCTAGGTCLPVGVRVSAAYAADATGTVMATDAAPVDASAIVKVCFASTATPRAFELAPTAGAGWADVTACGYAKDATGRFTWKDACVTQVGTPPKGRDVRIAYTVDGTATGALRPGLVADAAGNLSIALGSIVRAVPTAGCKGCHASPDGKKSGRTYGASFDVHDARNMACVDCHPAGAQHEIAKGDAVIGSVRNDLDGSMQGCRACHLASNPALLSTGAHQNVPAGHFDLLACQACHIRYVDPGSGAAEVQPELFHDMASDGTQAVFKSGTFLRSDPLDPTRDRPGLTGDAAHRWYPGLRWYKGKVVTVKPLLSAWIGDWINAPLAGDSALIRPVPLRLVRIGLTGGPGGKVDRDWAKNWAGLFRTTEPYATGLTLADDDGDGYVEVNTPAEILAVLQRMDLAVDTYNVDPGTDTNIVTTPVLVKAGKVYYLSGGTLASFEIADASHDFSVSHDVVARRDAANPVVRPGAYGAGGCTDCHAPMSEFFFGKQLSNPIDETGHRVYREHWEVMGYAPARVAALTGASLSVSFLGTGSGRVTSVGSSAIDCTGKGSGCATTVPSVGTPIQVDTAGGVAGWAQTIRAPGRVTLTASPAPGSVFRGWAGACAGLSACTVSVDAAKEVRALFDPQQVATVQLGVAVGPRDAAGNALGVVTSSPAGILCGTVDGPCTATYPPNTTVVLSVDAPPGAAWIWSGACAGSAPTCMLHLTQSTAASLTFR